MMLSDSDQITFEKLLIHHLLKDIRPERKCFAVATKNSRHKRHTLYIFNASTNDDRVAIQEQFVVPLVKKGIIFWTYTTYLK